MPDVLFVPMQLIVNKDLLVFQASFSVAFKMQSSILRSLLFIGNLMISSVLKTSSIIFVCFMISSKSIDIIVSK